MNDGGEENKRKEGKCNSPPKRSVPDDYGRAVSRVAVSQVCECVGFESIKFSALEALSDVAVRFIRDLGRSAVYYANLSGRSESNVFDIVKGLEDLGSNKGFLGASGVDWCAANSGALKELIDFVSVVEEVPFAQPIPRFPVVKSCKRLPRLQQTCSESSAMHIPVWLPSFPEPHTYLNSPMWNERQAESPVDKAEQVKQRRKAEKSLSRLQQRLMSGSSAGPSGSGIHAETPLEELGRGREGNSFLAPALPAGEKEASLITVPNKLVNREGCKKHGPFLEMFAPAINAAKSGETGMDTDRRSVHERRPVVHFSLKTRKKLLAEDVDVGLGSRGGERRAPAIGANEERDEKKRKAEQILRQSMEQHPQELTQM